MMYPVVMAVTWRHSTQGENTRWRLTLYYRNYFLTLKQLETYSGMVFPSVYHTSHPLLNTFKLYRRYMKNTLVGSSSPCRVQHCLNPFQRESGDSSIYCLLLLPQRELFWHARLWKGSQAPQCSPGLNWCIMPTLRECLNPVGELLARAALIHHDDQGHDVLMHFAFHKGLIIMCFRVCFSMKVGDHKHSSKVMFYSTGIGGADTINDKRWKLRKLSTILKELGDSEVSPGYG